MTLNSNLVELFKQRVLHQLENNILPFWLRNLNEGEHAFYGRISYDMRVQPKAPKGLILYSRLLWAFSAAYRFNQNPQCWVAAERAYLYLVDHFVDRDYGGMYWLLDWSGKTLDPVKKIYGQAFAIYGLSEYYSAGGAPESLELAYELFGLIERYSYDSNNKGYFEAMARDWSPTENLKLSDIDMNEPKSMNTHLHIMEAYTNLYSVDRRRDVKDKLKELLEVHLDHIIDSESRHFKLFFGENWEPKSGNISFGHEIEAAWLLCRGAEILEDASLLDKYRRLAGSIADNTLQKGTVQDRGVCYEQKADGSLDQDVHWWVQAEAVVGYLHTYQCTNQLRYFEAAFRAWSFIEEHLVDQMHGEWHYRVDSNRQVVVSEGKVSEWKGPYHNVRACLEIINRLTAITNS